MRKDKMTITFVIGGARSGKSSHAELIAGQHDGKRIYIATAQPFDDEMRDRIARHKLARKGKFSDTIEEPVDLADALDRIPANSSVALVDCLTVWVGNLLHHRGLLDRYDEIDRFLGRLDAPSVPLVIVSNEVGQGIVPGDPMSRHFRDHAGWLNQAVAQKADRVIWMVAGIPVVIKGEALS